MGFLYPIWLFSIGAVAIPLLIHLWNIRPGRTLKVGSIALIETSSRKTSRSIKLLDLLLLLLRCLLLITVALVLGMPFLQKAGTKAGKGWLLIPKEDFKEAYLHFKPKADSLLQDGYELHYFDAGFKKINITDALSDTAVERPDAVLPYWDLLQELNSIVTGSSPVYLITPALLDKFVGDRPTIPLKLIWQTYTPADSTSTQIKKAWFTANKDIHVVSEASKPSGIYYHAENIDPAIKNPLYAVSIKNGKPTIGLNKKKQSFIAIDTAALAIEIFGGANSPDVGYVRAALQGIAQFTQKNIRIDPFNSASKNSEKNDWLFWLSDKPVSSQLFAHYKNILVYEGGKATLVNTWIKTGSDGNQSVSLYKSVISGRYQGDAIWTDGFGNPVLCAEGKGNTPVYHLYTHFNPAWNELVWSPNFPRLLLQLISPGNVEGEKSSFDRRKIDVRQANPNIVAANTRTDRNIPANDVTHYFWLFLALIFVLERWLAHKKLYGTVINE